MNELSPRGFVLMPVVLALVVVATLALLLNLEGPMTVEHVAAEAEATKVEFLTHAGLAHAEWQLQGSECTGDFVVPTTALAAGTYTATTTGIGATTSYNLAVDQDAWIESGDVTSNNGASIDQHISFDTGDIVQALYRFDLSSLPASAQINSASAWFYIEVGEEHPEGPITVHRVTADWTETGATWETMNGNFEASVLAMIPPQDQSAVWVRVNLTAQVQAWVNGQPNFGVLLGSTAEGVHGEYVSREGAAGQQPRLDVVVGTGPASPANIQVSGTLAGGNTRTLDRPGTAAYQPSSTLILQPGAADAKDTYLYEWKASWNYGADTELFVSNRFANSYARSLLDYDLSGIPHGARIVSAILELYQTSASALGGTVGIRHLKADWIEGTNSGGTGTGATWNEREPGIAWATAGGDVNLPVVATAALPAATLGYFQWDIAALVEKWVSGDVDILGLVLEPVAAATEVKFASSDDADPTLHPKLTITYACACATPCLAPQGSGKVLMVVGNPSNLTLGDVAAQTSFEGWGYTVTLIHDDDSQGNFDAAVAANDVAYVSESVDAGTVDTKLTGATIGVVSAKGALNEALGIASGYGSPVGDAITMIDNSHEITRVFPTGVLRFKTAVAESTTVSGTLAPGALELAQIGAAGGLIAIEAGAELESGGSAAGRRVLVPVGEADYDWFLNNNGRLIVQRAIEWGTVETGVCTDYTFDTRIAAGVDDAEERADTSMYLDSTDLELVTESSVQTIGMRFDDIGVPSGANINAVSIDFTVDEVDSTATSLTLRAEAVDDAAAFGAGPSDISSRPTSSAAVAWDNVAAWTTVGEVQSTPDLWTLVQEVVDRPGWALGNALAIIVTGSGTRTAEAYEGDAANAPRLNIQFCATAFGPVAHWKLDETSGSLALDSEGGHDATLTGGGWTAGELDGGVVLDGSSEYLSAPDDDTLDLTETFTLLGWVNNGSLGGYDLVFNKGDSGNDQNFWFGTNGDEISFGFYDGGMREFTTAGANLMTDTWHHIAATFDNGSDEVRLYLDGTEVYAGTTTREPLVNDGVLYIGRSQYGEYWDGALDDLRIDASALSAAEIAALAVGGASRVLLVVPDAASLSAQDAAKQALLQSWGYTVNLITASDPQAAFDAAVATSDVVYISEETTSGDLNTKLRDAAIGIVDEEVALHDEFGIASGGAGYTETTISIIDDQHYITAPFGTGPLVITAVSEALHSVAGTLSPILNVLAEGGGAGTLVTLSTGDLLHDGGTAAGRRVSLPWGGNAFDIGSLTDDGRHLMLRAIKWAAGAGKDGIATCAARFADDFETNDYSGSTGTSAWATNWVEINENGNSATGDEIVALFDGGNRAVRVRDNDGGGEGVGRQLNLSPYSSAVLEFDYWRGNLDDANDYATVDYSNDGGAIWTEVARIEGPGNDSAANPQHMILDITGAIAPNARIRFLTSPTMGSSDAVLFDEVEICAN